MLDMRRVRANYDTEYEINLNFAEPSFGIL